MDVAGANSNNPRLCLSCVETPFYFAKKEFKNSLDEKQKKLFRNYAVLYNHRRHLIELEMLRSLKH